MNDSIHKQYWNDRFKFWHFWKAMFNCFTNFTFSLFSISFLRTPRCLTTDWPRRTSPWLLVWPVRAPPGSHRRQRSCRCWTSPSCSPRSSWVRWPLCPLCPPHTDPPLPRCWPTPWSRWCSLWPGLAWPIWLLTWPRSSSGLRSLSGDLTIMTSGVWWHVMTCARCAWMLNCPVLNLGEGGKIVLNRKMQGFKSGGQS